MENVCVDTAFGRMSYKHRWIKEQSITLFGKQWNVTIVAKAYSGKMITEEQRSSYSLFMNREKEFQNIIAEKLLEYISSESLGIDNVIKSYEYLTKIVTPKTVLFKQDGTTIVLFDTELDREHGIAVKIFPDVAVGVQDLFL